MGLQSLTSAAAVAPKSSLVTANNELGYSTRRVFKMNHSARQLVVTEDKATHGVSRETYAAYISAGGGILKLLFVVLLFGSSQVRARIVQSVRLTGNMPC